MNWKVIQGYPDYIVCDNGSVYSFKKRRSTELKGGTDTWGYKIITLSDKAKAQTHKVHRLVAQAFLGGRPEGLVIDHINGNKSDNRADNLQYITQRENIHKIKRTGKSTPLGVRFHKPSGKFQARIYQNKHISLGYYNTAEEASLAYQQALSNSKP